MFRSHKDICQFMADIQDLQKFFASSEDLHSIVRNREETVFRKEGIMNSNKMKKTRRSFVSSEKSCICKANKNLENPRQREQHAVQLY